MFSCSWEEPNVQGGLQSPPVLFTPQQGNHRVSTGRGIPALLWMLSSCAAAQSCFWASFTDSATLKASPVQMAWHGLSFTLLESGCVTLDVLAVTAKQALSSTGSVVGGQATLAAPQQPRDHTTPIKPSAHRAPQKNKVSKNPRISSHCNSSVYPP